MSNHGGRVLDSVPASLDALPRIAEAVDGALPLLLDGGIRRGSDILKALALGASAVLIGRPYIHALATAGALGVAHLLRTLENTEVHWSLECKQRLGGIPEDMAIAAFRITQLLLALGIAFSLLKGGDWESALLLGSFLLINTFEKSKAPTVPSSFLIEMVKCSNAANYIPFRVI